MNNPAHNRVDRTGQRYGRLTVECYHETRGKVARWLCRCDCGNEKVVSGGRLGRGTKSCGCLHREVIKSPRRLYTKLSDHDAAIRHFKNTYVGSAKQRGLEFSLSDSDVSRLAVGSCTYCGIIPSLPSKRSCRRKRVDTKTLVNGIDRVDSAKGYVSGNVVSCCFNCNRAKGTMDIPEFKQWIEKIYNHSIMHDAERSRR